MFKISARTVLELGAELISSDLIAFYELIKNCFDARSPTGAEIAFQIVLRRNVYLKILNESGRLSEAASQKEMQREEVDQLIQKLRDELESSAPGARGEAFLATLGQPPDHDAFKTALGEAYRTHNTITVSDSGSGMSLEDLEQVYLRIGTASRKHAVDESIESGSTTSPFLGEKGIGRLSAMRLGERLRVETARAEDTAINVLVIDWSLFRNVDALITDISVYPLVGHAKLRADWSGTQLTIADISEDWSQAKVVHLADELARIVDPFEDRKKRPRVALFWNGARVSIPMMDRDLLSHAHAKFVGKYELHDGQPALTLTLDAVNLGFEHPRETETLVLAGADLQSLVEGTEGAVPESVYTDLGPFTVEAYWFNRRLLTAIESIGNLKAVREQQKKWSGLSLYRDRFRVIPYGDDGDDWLGLDRKALGSQRYLLNKQQFIGRISISRTGNPNLVDQTNREGLRETPEKTVLIGMLQMMVEKLRDHMKYMERYKKEPVDVSEIKSETKRMEGRVAAALKRIRTLIPKDQTDVLNELRFAFDEFKDLVARAERHVSQVEEDSRHMIQMAGVGLMVEVVAHELARASENALMAIERLRVKDLPADARAQLANLQSEMKTVSKRLRVLDPLSVSGRQRAETFDLAALITDIQEAHSAEFARRGVVFKFELPTEPVRVRAVKGMVVQILENLISNSTYWMQLRQAKESGYRPEIRVALEDDPVTISVSDNGPGIAHDNREKVFRAFWSLKEQSKRRGLGLYIAKECAQYLGGDLSLKTGANPDARLREFVLELPGG